MAISSPGPVCVPGTTRAPASGDPIACARAHPGSRPPSPKAPGPPPVRRPATCRPSSIDPARRGAKKAIAAVAASILTAIYHMLTNGTLYQDLGADHFDRRGKTAQTKRLVAKLQNLGYAVQITPLAA